MMCKYSYQRRSESWFVMKVLGPVSYKANPANTDGTDGGENDDNNTHYPINYIAFRCAT